MALVLDRVTGLVSPQFHVKFDPQFQIPTQGRLNSQWQLKAGFVAQREKDDKGRAKANPTSAPATETQNPKGDPNSSSEGGDQPHKRKRERFEPHVGNKTQCSKAMGEIPGTTQKESDVQAAAKASLREASEPIQSKSSEMEQASPEPSSTLTQSNNSSQSLTQPNLIQAALTEISMHDTSHFNDNVEGEIFCFTALCPYGYNPHQLDPLYVYKTTADPDTLYYHEACKQHDKKEFFNAMQKEIDDRMKDNNFSIVHKSEVPKDATILPAVWQLRRKRDIKTRKIKKYKARLNIDGSRMQKGIHYDESYAPVASWNSIRMLLTLTAVHGWHTKQLDYVAAFPQAPVERELYMKIPAGVDVTNGNAKDHVLKLHKNTYGQKNAGRVWNKYLVHKLIREIGFKQSKVDECVFYHGNVMYVLCTDDSILAGPCPKEIDRIIERMRNAKLDITIEGDLEDFLGVNIDRRDDGTIHLTQPHLIDSILKDLRLDGEGVTTKRIPASSSKLLKRHADSKAFDGYFNYRSVIGKLNYLERGSRSDIAYIVHQCARFTSDPKKEHAEAIAWLGRYLLGTRDKGTILKPIKGDEMKVYVDADFAGNFDKKDTQNRDTARSRHGYFIMYEGCPITWKSQLQTEICLSSTESEYCGLSYALRETIPLMQLLREMKRLKFPVATATPTIKCRVFEDNSGALEMATNHKFRPRTKHLNVKLHHFRDYVARKEISIEKIDTLSQLAS